MQEYPAFQSHLDLKVHAPLRCLAGNAMLEKNSVDIRALLPIPPASCVEIGPWKWPTRNEIHDRIDGSPVNTAADIVSLCFPSVSLCGDRSQLIWSSSGLSTVVMTSWYSLTFCVSVF